MGHAAYLRKAPDVLLSNDINFVQIGVRTRELWLPEVGSSELFFHVFPVKIPVKRGMLPANREFHVVAGVVIFPTHPGPRVNLQRVGKTLRAKAAVREKNVQNLWLIFPRFLSQFARVFDLAPDVGFRRSWYRRKACAAYFCKVPDLRESELGLVRYGPANRGHRVFLVRWRTFFRSGFRLDPVNSWRSESSTSCMNVSSFQRAQACGSTCCESGRLCAQAWQRRWENSGIFSTALFRRSVFTCVVDVAPDIGFRRSWYRRKAYATYFPKVHRPCTEASLGSQDMILRTEAVGMFLMPRGHLLTEIPA
uniref:Uncharacterized protein n=1 Tax=Fagus sylvatica TaxID=28930 RepID=A0A2N9ETE8_FAGSY